MPKLEYMVPDGANPRWSNAEGTRVDLQVVFPHLGQEPVLYTAAQSDPGWEHSEDIFERAVAGGFGPITPYVAPETVPPPITARQLRIGLLREGITADMVIYHINQISNAAQREEARVEWEYATEYRFDHPLVGLVTEQMARTSEEVKAAWISWASI